MKWYFRIIMICVFRVNGQNKRTTMRTSMFATSTEYIMPHQDLDESYVQETLNLDYGRYTTQKYRYINSQYASPKPIDKCQDDYIKCLTTQGVAIPVCAYNKVEDNPREDGFFQADSYCDVFYDNCRRYIRFWRILGYGTCEVLVRHGVYRWIIPMSLRKFSEVMLDNQRYKSKD